MRKRLPLIGLTLIMVVLLDILVGLGLLVGGKIGGPFDKLITYFDYGRSVPGKQAYWENNPGVKGNLYDVAWRPDLLALSAEKFTQEDSRQPVLRAYGMSFLNDITRAAEAQREGLIVDRHAGPAATPNFVFSVFQDDAPNRKPGDIVVMGILSSSLAPTQTFSNSSWLFEQPAPFTYPIYELEGDNLVRIDPIVTTAAQHRTLPKDDELRRAWRAQRREHDAYFSSVTHDWTWADISPLGRLIRRYAATYTLAETEQNLLGTGGRKRAALNYGPLLTEMSKQFAQSARAEGLVPIVVLIQTRGNYPDLKEALAADLEANGIPYLATVDFHSPKDPTGYKPDGHFKKDQNAAFGAALLSLIDQQQTDN